MKVLTLNRAKPLQLRPSPVFGYVRKSTEDADRQVMSLERQREAIERFVREKGWDVVDLWFEETQSAKDFARPVYLQMLATCEANAQRGQPGRVICLDYDRFARSVDKQLKVSPIEYQRQVIRLHDAGFELDYVLSPKSGNALQDGLTGALKSLMAGEYIEKLSVSSRSGKRKAGINGCWNGGPAPFPAERYDARTGRRLERGERASNGQSVLGPPADAARVQHWIDGANAIIAGESLDAVALTFGARGVENFYGGNWRHAHILKIFTNPALIGKVEYEFTRDDGTIESFEGDARWPAIVPVALFHAVRKALTKRKKERARASRDYVLTPECQHCGARYVAATYRKKGVERRYYTHPVPTSKMNDVQAARTAKAGCKHWYLEAEELEASVRDLIIAQRGSKEFAQTFVELMTEHDAIDLEAERLERDAEKHVKTLGKKRDNLRTQLEDADDAETRDYLLTRVSELTKEIKAARDAWGQARQRRESTVELNDELLRLVEEAQNVSKAWKDLDRRRAIVDTWVFKLLVEIEREEGRERNNKRVIRCFLRTAPYTPYVLGIDPIEGKSSSELLRSIRKGKRGPLDPEVFVL